MAVIETCLGKIISSICTFNMHFLAFAILVSRQCYLTTVLSDGNICFIGMLVIEASYNKIRQKNITLYLITQTWQQQKQNGKNR